MFLLVTRLAENNALRPLFNRCGKSFGEQKCWNIAALLFWSEVMKVKHTLVITAAMFACTTFFVQPFETFLSKALSHLFTSVCLFPLALVFGHSSTVLFSISFVVSLDTIWIL